MVKRSTVAPSEPMTAEYIRQSFNEYDRELQRLRERVQALEVFKHSIELMIVPKGRKRR